MIKRIANLLLCVCLILTMVQPAWAWETEQAAETVRELTISTPEEFREFAENCRLDSYSQNLTVYLKQDIDLGNEPFSGIPSFSGRFEGGNHILSGVNVDQDGSAQGLFRYLTETAEVTGLNVRGTVTPGGSRSLTGGIAGENSGVIRNCSFIGTVSGSESIGGLAGRNRVSGIIENCRVSGAVSGTHFTGGIAGENDGVIRGCVNLAKVNTLPQQNTVALEDITLGSLTNTESANTVTDIGGIAGNSCGVIRSCENRGPVGYRHMGYNIGGIAGSQSGYIVDCVNYAAVQGRKEVGGIAGQMEPAAMIEYAEDALQILQKQLDAVGQSVSRAVSNAQIGAHSMTGKIFALQGYVWDAMDAVGSLIPDLEDPSLPDMDEIQAAKNGISNSLAGMTTTLWGVGASTQSTIGTLTNDLNRIKEQLDAMRNTLNNVSETLGGSLQDVSDQDTPLDLTGKIQKCVNHGDVLGDLNAGGITGAIALENDLDPEDDWTIQGENSLNFESSLRAVVLDCENQGLVTVTKQNGGGIVGWQSMGLVKSCINTGMVDGEGAVHIGGISGRSGGYIRQCGAKCQLSGSSYVGGIAGRATVLTDSRAIVRIIGASEKTGALLGMLEEQEREEDDPLSGNYYVAEQQDIGAVDGISYAAMAQPLSQEEFLALEQLSDCFRSVVLRFRTENGVEKEFRVPLGGDFDPEKIPAVPVKDGGQGTWENLQEAQLFNILFDMTFRAVYTAPKTVIQSQEARQGRAELLLEGVFTEASQVIFRPSDSVPQLPEGLTPAQCWSITVTGAESVSAARLLLPEDMTAEKARIFLQDAEGIWQEIPCTVDGSYLVFPLERTDCQLALLAETSPNWLLPVAGVGAAGVVLLLCLLRKKKTARKSAQNETV